MIFEVTTHSAGQTERLGEIVGRFARGGQLIALAGELGAGKTCFVRGVARGMGLDDAQVSSPTFVICHEHATNNPAGLRLVHVDAYRLGGADELESIGWDEMLRSPRTVLAVEWPQRIESALPVERISVELAHIPHRPDARRVQISGGKGLKHILDQLRVEAQSWADHASAVETNCPTCGRPVPRSTSTSPFCSTRCRMADLNRWFSGEYRVSRPMQSVDDDDLSEA
jgi:tRNA threonylcarbamoyladenosine biosynthesis protein TsaE